MIAPPFLLRRPWLLLRDLLVSREHPDLGRLGAIRDPDRFVWAILPHAARTFSSCIALLPSAAARAAAVGYLYCRILDTHEDLSPDPDAREAALLRFARRLDQVPPTPPPPVPRAGARDERDRAHLLLARHTDRVDRAYARLPPPVRRLVRRLVHGMAEGMGRFSRIFAEQGGVLSGDGQVLEYCRVVIGEPVVFTLRLLLLGRTGEEDLPPVLREAAMRVAELVQLANVTRDIEKDLRRGIAYHPALRAHLSERQGPEAERGEAVRAARRHLMRLALDRAPAYRTLLGALERPRLSLARASALLMLLYTERYYRGCARRAGLPSWPGRSGGEALVTRALPALWSPAWADRVCREVEHSFGRTGVRP